MVFRREKNFKAETWSKLQTNKQLNRLNEFCTKVPHNKKRTYIIHVLRKKKDKNTKASKIDTIENVFNIQAKRFMYRI